MNSHFHLFSDRIQRIEFNIASKLVSREKTLCHCIQRIEFNIASKLQWVKSIKLFRIQRIEFNIASKHLFATTADMVEYTTY